MYLNNYLLVTIANLMTVLCAEWVFMLFSKTGMFDLVSGRSSTKTEGQDAFTTTQTKQDDGPLTDPDYSRWQTEIVAGKYSMSVSSGDRVITAGTNFCRVCKQLWTMLHNHLTHGSLDKVAATKTTCIMITFCSKFKMMSTAALWKHKVGKLHLCHCKNWAFFFLSSADY